MRTPSVTSQPRPSRHSPPFAPLALHVPAALELDDERLFLFCQANRSLRIERDANGDLDIMPPTGAETGARNAELIAQFQRWARDDGQGILFDSSTGFLLPNGAMRSPDLAWVRRSRLATLSPEQKRGFLPLAPDVLIELASASDEPRQLHAKMLEWRANGAALGWLILPEPRQVWRYEPEHEPSCLDHPARLEASDLLPGLSLQLARIWETDF